MKATISHDSKVTACRVLVFPGFPNCRILYISPWTSIDCYRYSNHAEPYNIDVPGVKIPLKAANSRAVRTKSSTTDHPAFSSFKVAKDVEQLEASSSDFEELQIFRKCENMGSVRCEWNDFQTFLKSRIAFVNRVQHVLWSQAKLNEYLKWITADEQYKILNYPFQDETLNDAIDKFNGRMRDEAQTTTGTVVFVTREYFNYLAVCFLWISVSPDYERPFQFIHTSSPSSMAKTRKMSIRNRKVIHRLVSIDFRSITMKTFSLAIKSWLRWRGQQCQGLTHSSSFLLLQARTEIDLRLR